MKQESKVLTYNPPLVIGLPRGEKIHVQGIDVTNHVIGMVVYVVDVPQDPLVALAPYAKVAFKYLSREGFLYTPKQETEMKLQRDEVDGDTLTEVPLINWQTKATFILLPQN